ncbi:MAG TPA: ParA family protein [Acidimicrobiia bacterium]|nr:ParA family protein [Acidimicrobiia bacterium]
MVAVAIANQKGGVGKTTVTLGLAEVAMSHGLRVLVVDCDPQANASAGLGLSTDTKNTLADVLDREIELSSINAAEYITRSSWSVSAQPMANKHATPGSIDVISAHPHLTNVETHLASDPIGACDRLDRSLAGIADTYDLILFDCPPSVGLLTINALFAADRVIVVSAPSAWSSDGVQAFMQNVDRIAARRSGQPHVAGIIVNNVGRTRDGRFWESEIIERYKDNVVSIASRAAIAEASAMSTPLSDLGARPGAAEAFQNFDEVFLHLIGLEVGELSNSRDHSHNMTAQSIAAAV